MYTNELLEAKYNAQKELAEQAKKEQKEYLKLVEEEVLELFKRKGWPIVYSPRKGGFLKQSNNIVF